MLLDKVTYLGHTGPDPSAVIAARLIWEVTARRPVGVASVASVGKGLRSRPRENL